MDLLSPAQVAQIRNALRDVTDTFAKQPIKYMLRTGESMDRYQEDRRDLEFTEYNLLALMEYNTDDKDEIAEQVEGAYSKQSVKLTFNREYLEEQNLIDPTTDKVIFKDTADYFMVDTTKYKVNSVIHDGPIDGKFILVVVQGVIDNNY